MQTPTENEIFSLLENIQPQPGPGLRARVANMTWNRTAPEPRRPVWFAPVGFRRGSLRRAAYAALAVIGVLIVFFTVPPFNGIAQRVANFFVRSDQDTRTISLTPQPPSQQFPLTLAEVATRAGFPIHQPEWVPDGFRFNGAEYDADRQAVLLDYHSPLPGKFLRLTQSQIAENRLDVSSIGPGTEVQTVDIHTTSGEIVSGEYVAGAWRLPTIFDHLQTGQPDLSATMQANWDPQAKIHMLRWVTEGILYEIIHADQSLDTLSAEILVKIAESIK